MIIKITPFVFLLGVSSAFPSGIFSSSLTKSKLHSHRGKHNQVGIYDGQNAKIDEFPYLVGINTDSGNEFVVAGAVLNQKWVITVAFWISDYDASELQVVASSSDGTTGTKHNVTELVFHPNFEYGIDYDYALLKVEKKFKWSDTLGNVSLPTQAPTVKTALTVAGWGSSAAGEIEVGLHQGTMKWISLIQCAKMYIDYGLTERMGCVYNKGKTTICNNDYGDPFVKDGVLYGIAKDAAIDGFCTSTAYPVIVSNIYPVVDWIQTQIAN